MYNSIVYFILLRLRINSTSYLMKNFTLILLIFLTIQLSAQDFYDLYTVQTIKITFAESNWDQLLNTEKAGN